MKRTSRKKDSLWERWIESRFGLFLKRNAAVVRSLGIFIGVILLFVVCLPLYRGFVNGPLPVAVAQSTGFVLRVFGVDAQVSGTAVASSIFSVDVIPACTGLFAYVFLFAAVCAYPCRWVQKAIGVGLAFPAIYAINLIRMVSLFYIGAYLPRLFDAAHLLFWQSLMIASAVLIWLVWARRVSHVRR